MTKVEIDVEKLGSAINAAQGLAQLIDSQRHTASKATPSALPTLGDDTGHASYEVSVDSLTNVQQLLGEQLSQQAEALGYDAEPDEIERFASIMATWQDDPEVTKADGGASRDAQRQAVIDLVGDAAGLVPLPGADAVGFGWNQATNVGTDAAGGSFANEEARAVDDADSRADDAATRGWTIGGPSSTSMTSTLSRSAASVRAR